MGFSSASGRGRATKSLQPGQMDFRMTATHDALGRTGARYTAANARPWDAGSPRDTNTHRWGDHMSPDHGASPARAPDSAPIRRLLGAATLALTALLATAAASAAQPAPRTPAFVWHAQPRIGNVATAAVIRKTTWLSGFRITEYYPAPEAWAVGKPVAAPGLPGKHRIDWLYGGFGLSMEGTGIGLDGRLYHIDSLGHGGWVSRGGKATFDGVHANGAPYWRAGGFWRNSRKGVTFLLLAGGWSNGVGMSWVAPPRGISFAPGAGTPGLRYWRTIAVDPSLIRFGSRVYIPYYRQVRGATGWFVANDTGGAIGGRHIDVYRAPPSNPDDGGRSLSRQRVLIIPPGGRVPKGVPPPPGSGSGGGTSGSGHTPSGGTTAG
jgi:3D (Asp-Asp-Asp) domain-containing protein